MTTNWSWEHPQAVQALYWDGRFQDSWAFFPTTHQKVEWVLWAVHNWPADGESRVVLDEIKLKIIEATMVTVSRSTICRVLQRNGYTRKILQVAKQRCTELEGCSWLKYCNTRVIFLSGSMKRDQTIVIKSTSLDMLWGVYHRCITVYLSEVLKTSTIVAMGCEVKVW